MPHRFMLVVLFSAALAVGLSAADDTADVKAHIDAARKLAGRQWSTSVDLFCATQQEVTDMHILPSANANDVAGQVAEPIKLFDNLYFVGQKTVATWVISTPGGLVMIDSGYKERVEDTMLAGMKKLGLNPADLKYVLIAHEHADHFGGAKYLQEHYSTLHIAMSEPAWQALERPGRNGQPQADVPKRDVVLE